MTLMFRTINAGIANWAQNYPVSPAKVFLLAAVNTEYSYGHRYG